MFCLFVCLFVLFTIRLCSLYKIEMKSQNLKFKVCKSVHHHTIKINQPTRCNNFSSLLLMFMYSSTCFRCPHAHHQPTRCNNFSSLLLMFMYSSTCFRCPHAHHQELNNCSSSLWFYRWSVGGAVLLVVVRPTTTNSYHHAPTVKPEAATAIIELLMIGVRTPETCWAVHKRQVINLRNCCI